MSDTAEHSWNRRRAGAKPGKASRWPPSSTPGARRRGRSAPKLAVDDAGAFVGSVSGGCVEGAVVEEALAAISDGKPRLLDFGVSDEQAWEVGLACGGKIEIFVERVE